jgi:hypothetical protein
VEQRVVTRFQQLWALRFALKEYRRTDVKLRGINPGPELTQAQRETLEGNGYTFISGNHMPGPQVAGMIIRAGLLRLSRNEAADTEWSVATSSHVEFLVPDSFRTIRTMPLSPNCCLLAIPSRARELAPTEVVFLNHIAALQSVRYCFARDFSRTGIELGRLSRTRQQNQTT